MKKEIKILNIYTELVKDKQHILINGKKQSISSEKFQELRNLMWEQENLLDKIERINIEAEKIILFERAKSIYSIEKMKELLKI